MRIAPLALALVACSSSTTRNTEPTCTIAGTYDVTETVDTSKPNTCNFKDDALVVTITADGDISYQGISGSCRGTFASCKLTASCPVGTAAGPATAQISWTFDDKGFTGTYDFGSVNAPKCTTAIKNTGIRK